MELEANRPPRNSLGTLSDTDPSSLPTPPGSEKTLAIVGGGLAGLAAAEKASRQGYRVTLFDRARVLGGRAASLFDPTVRQWIDNGQHILMGCCRELLALNRRLGISDRFHRHDSIPFAKAGRPSWTLSAVPLLPRRYQLAPAMFRMPFLTFAERWKTARLIQKLEKQTEFDDRSFLHWLREQGASDASVAAFWTPIVYSALCETLDNVCPHAVRKVIRDGFLAGHNAMAIHVPQNSLREIYNDAITEPLRDRGIHLKLLTRIRRIHWSVSGKQEEPPTFESLELSDGSTHRFDACILAVPPFQAWEIF